MANHTRTSYPAVYGLEVIPRIAQVLLKASLPLAALCDNKKLKPILQRRVSEWRRAVGLDVEPVTLSVILGFVGKRKIGKKDMRLVIPTLDLSLIDVFETPPRSWVENYLTGKGIELAITSSPKPILFEAIMSNRILPLHFAHAVECQELYNRVMSVEELEDQLQIPSGGKRPEAKCVIRWAQYLGINDEAGLRIRLDRPKTVHSLLFCFKRCIERILNGKEVIAFSEVRRTVMDELNLRPSFEFDRVFEILYKAQREGVFSFKSGREAIVGAWKGSPSYSFISLRGEISIPSVEYVSAIVQD